MFSFVEDTVVDPFCGSGTTMVTASCTGRNSIGVETEEYYCNYILSKMENNRTIVNPFDVNYVDLTHEKDKYISHIS